MLLKPMLRIKQLYHLYSENCKFEMAKSYMIFKNKKFDSKKQQPNGVVCFFPMANVLYVLRFIAMLHVDIAHYALNYNHSVFFDLRLLFTHLVSSNLSKKKHIPNSTFKMYPNSPKYILIIYINSKQGKRYTTF